MKFWTQEWVDALEKGVTADKDVAEAMKGQSLKILWVGTDCPDRLDRSFIVDIRNGKLQPMKMEEKPAPSDWRAAPFDATKYLARISGKYEDLTKIGKGELSPLQVLAGGAFKIDGSMMKLMSMVVLFVGVFKVVTSIVCEY